MWEANGLPVGAEHGNTKSLVGRRFGLLTVVAFARRRTTGRSRGLVWRCACDCGGAKDVDGSNLNGGRTRSCGCATKRWIGDATRTHGKRHTPEYTTWVNVRDRCYDDKNETFDRYGGRGIWVCGRWRGSFEHFLEDMGERPSSSHSIDRKDNDGGYTCGKCADCVAREATANCRWATRLEQANNTARNHRVEHGDEVLTIAEWSRRVGVSQSTIIQRLDRGWSFADSIGVAPRRIRHRPPLTLAECSQIAALRVAGKTIASIALHLGLSPTTVKKSLRGQSTPLPSNDAVKESA